MLKEFHDTAREILVRIPAGSKSQLVFRSEFTGEVALAAQGDLQFHWCDDVRSYARLSNSLRNTLGFAGTLKGAIKSLTRRRIFYAVSEAGDVLHRGWITLGRCMHYWIEPNAAVIGPIWTSSQARGRGIATFAVSHAINKLIDRDYTTIYIDTSLDNEPCLRVIEKCGFGRPIATYIRPCSNSGR